MIEIPELSVPCLQLKSQSVKLQVNMQKNEIDCLASYELTIGYSASQKEEIDLQPSMDFILYAKQQEIKNVEFFPPQACPQGIKMVRQQYMTNEKQSNLLKMQKAFRQPCSYMALNSCLNKIQDEWQQILLSFKFMPDKLESTNYEYLKSLEEQLMRVEISYTISQPIAGLRFIQNLDNKFLITEKSLHNSRNWIPTPHVKQQKYPPYCHEEKDLLHYTKVIVIVPSSYYAVVSGTLIEIVEIEENNQLGYVFEIKDFINPDDLGIFVAQFQHFYSQFQFDEFKLNVFHLSGEVKIFESDPVHKIFEAVERFWFKDPLLQRAREILQIGAGSQFFNKLNVLILPNVFKQGYFSFYPFRNILVFDESQIPEALPCKHTQDEFYKCLHLQLNSLALKLFLAPSLKFSDRWIELGFAFQSTWIEDHAQLHQKLLEQVKKGQDVKLDQQSFEQRFLLESLEYQLKTRMVITMMARMTHQPDIFIKEILKRFYQDLQGCIPAPLSTDKIFMSMKKVFSVKKGKSFIKMFIKSAGAWHFKVSYDYERDHKLNLNITQSPLIGHWVHVYTNNYIQGAKALDAKSDIVNQYLQYQEKLKHTQKQVLKAFKDFEEQQKEQTYDQSKKSHSSSTIRDFRRRDYQISASGLIPEELSMPLHFSGSVRIQVAETNELKLEIQDREITILPRLWSKIDINCTQKLKKYNIPKRHLEINAQAYYQQEQTGMLEIENDNNNQVKTPMIHGILGEAILKSGVNINTGREQTIKSYSEEIQKEPPQWIKWDPVGLTVKEVEYYMQKELTVMCQVLKEKDMNQIACVLRNIKKLEIRERVVKTIVLIIENSYAHLESSVIVQLLQLLREMVNKSSIKRLEENSDFEDMVELQAYLKLAEKITYRYFFNQNDNSVKYFKFNNFDEYDIIVALFKNLRRLNTASTLGFHNELIILLVTILSQYDNSQNNYDCSFLISKLIKLLLHTNCNQSKFQIMAALKHELKKVIFLNTTKNYILKTIVIYYRKFVEINFTGALEQIIEQAYKQYDDEISSIIKHHQQTVMPQIDNGYLERAYYKKYMMEQFEKFKREPYQFVLDQLYYLSKRRVNYGQVSICFNNLLQELQLFVVKNYVKFAHELSRADINPELAKTLANTLFECLITGPSLLNYNVQHNFASIYRVLFYYFAPLRIEETHKDIRHLVYTLTNFTPDQQWSQSHLLQLQDETEELRQRTFGSQIKKNRPPNRITNQDLVQQLERFAKKNPLKLTEREITKQILKYLATLPQIRQLEDKEGIELSPQSKQIYRIDQVRASMKRKIQPMNTIMENVISMISNYYRKQQITKTEFEEYVIMIKKFFDDGKKILDTYEPSKLQLKLDKMRVKSSLLEINNAKNSFSELPE